MAASKQALDGCGRNFALKGLDLRLPQRSILFKSKISLPPRARFGQACGVDPVRWVKIEQRHLRPPSITETNDLQAAL